jgi:uncharacterized protein YbaR (Trm112 family)
MTTAHTPELAQALSERLCCPETGQPLDEAPQDRLDALNARIQQGALSTRGGRPLDRAVRHLLLRRDGAVAFLADPFPMLLPDDAIDMTDLA